MGTKEDPVGVGFQTVFFTNERQHEEFVKLLGEDKVDDKSLWWDLHYGPVELWSSEEKKNEQADKRS